MERMSDERLAEIENLIREYGADHPEAGPQVTTLEVELLQALKAERAEVEEQCRINGQGAGREAKLQAEIEQLQSTFALRWAADRRAIKRWQEATGKERTWPYHADLCVWLLEQLDSAESRLSETPNA